MTNQPTDTGLVGEVPDQIGKYEIVGLVGRGSMGAVYQARDPFLDRDVALKLMLPRIASDVEKRHRFEREARAVAKLVHPNVVTVFDLGYHIDGSPYIAMEFLRGLDLSQALRAEVPLGYPDKLGIVLQVLDGLAQAHRLEIVHRDIKPANVFLTDEHTVKIMDFGVARFAGASVSSASLIVGSPNYMSPEQASGERVDARSDLFSVGCLLGELLTGHTPFQSANMMLTLQRIVADAPTLDLPAGLEAVRPVLERALAKDRDARYANAEAFAEALRELLEAEEAQAPPRPKTAGAAVAEAPSLKQEPAPARPQPAPVVLPADRSGDPGPLFLLMRRGHRKRLSGLLHFSHRKEHRSLRLAEGWIVGGSSDVLGEHLGDVLVRYGRITLAQLEKAREVVLKERRKLGEVLAAHGSLDKASISQAVGLQVREILFSVVGRSDGSFFLEEGFPQSLEEDELPARTSILEMILETARRYQEPTAVRKVLGDMDRVVQLSTDPMFRASLLVLTPTEGFILSRIDGTLSAREVISLIPLPPDDTERSLFGLLCTGLVEYRQPGS